MSVAIQKLVTSDTERYRNTVFVFFFSCEGGGGAVCESVLVSNAQAKEKQKTKKKKKKIVELFIGKEWNYSSM